METVDWDFVDLEELNEGSIKIVSNARVTIAPTVNVVWGAETISEAFPETPVGRWQTKWKIGWQWTRNDE